MNPRRNVITLALFGCAVHPAAAAPTFKDVAQIIQAHCVECHRPGQIAPMSLVTFEQVRPWAAAIKQQVVMRKMPPWPASAPLGHFANDGRLTDEEISLIRAWVDSGAPAGDPPETASPSQFPGGWHFGDPDLILPMPYAQAIPGTGKEVWKYVYLDAVFDEDTWIRGLEIRPGNARLVHHANVQVVTPGGGNPGDWTSVERDVEAPQNDPPKLSGFDMVQIHIGLPGQFHLQTEPGSAILIPKYSRIRLNIHYGPSQKPETDRTEVGLYFARGRIVKQWRLQYSGPGESAIHIPAGKAGHAIQSSTKIPAAMTVYQVGAHMHLRGASYRVYAELPDGQNVELLNVTDFNFHWQFLYRLTKPISLPAGTILHDRATFDNSPRNPLVTLYDTPNRDVTFGNRTVDEMATSYILHTRDTEDLGLIIDANTGHAVGWARKATPVAR